MPIEYAGERGGVVKEHTAVRTAVGIFDVSHLGKLVVTGEGARQFLNSCLTNDLGKIGSGQAQYTLCSDDATGGVVDDLIVYLRADERLSYGKVIEVVDLVKRAGVEQIGFVYELPREKARP